MAKTFPEPTIQQTNRTGAGLPERTRWLGNTPNVALKHYLTVTEDHFQNTVENGGLAGDKTASNASHKKTRTLQEVWGKANLSEIVDILVNVQVAGTGFEPATSRL